MKAPTKNRKAAEAALQQLAKGSFRGRTFQRLDELRPHIAGALMAGASLETVAGKISETYFSVSKQTLWRYAKSRGIRRGNLKEEPKLGVPPKSKLGFNNGGDNEEDL